MRQGDVKEHLSIQFVKYWQSKEGAALDGETLASLKKLWQHTPPNQKQRVR